MPLSSTLETVVQRSGGTGTLETRAGRAAFITAVRADIASLKTQQNLDKFLHDALHDTLGSTHGIAGQTIYTKASAVAADGDFYYGGGAVLTIKETFDKVIAKFVELENLISNQDDLSGITAGLANLAAQMGLANSLDTILYTSTDIVAANDPVETAISKLDAAVGADTVFVYAPAGTAEGNVYTNFATLYTALLLQVGKTHCTLLFDNTNQNPALIPAGTYDMTGVSWQGSGVLEHGAAPAAGLKNTAILFSAGVTSITGLSHIQDLHIMTPGTVTNPPLHYTGGGLHDLHLHNVTMICGTTELIQVDNGDTLRMYWTGETYAESVGAGSEVIDCNGTLIHKMFDHSGWGADTLAGGATGDMTITFPFTATIGLPQTNYAGATSISRVGWTPEWITWPLFGTWGVDADGYHTNGGGIVGIGGIGDDDPGVTYAQAWDDGNSEWNQLSVTAAGTDYTSNKQLLSDTKNNDDAVYFGYDREFCEMGIDMSVGTPQTYGGNACTWEYWNGAWSALALTWDGTDSTANDGLQSFQQDGAISFYPPTDWVSTTVNGQAGFFIRCVFSTGANVTQIGLLAAAVSNHMIADPIFGFESHVDGYITELRMQAMTNSGLNNDTYFMIMNWTTGDHTAILQWVKGEQIRTESIAGTGLYVNEGDALFVLQTGEDGTTEYDGVVFSMLVNEAYF